MLQAETVTATEAAQAAQGMAAAVGSTNLGPGQDQITDALAKMPRAALYDIMAQMKGLIQQNQQQARQILVTNPSLTRALFQAQILLGMLKNPLSAEAAPPQVLPQGAPLQQPAAMPGPAQAPLPQQQQQPYQPPHIQQQQHAPALRPQHVAPNPTVQYPPLDLQTQPQQPLPGAPQALRNPHVQPMGVMPGTGLPWCHRPDETCCQAEGWHLHLPRICFLTGPYCLYMSRVESSEESHGRHETLWMFALSRERTLCAIPHNQVLVVYSLTFRSGRGQGGPGARSAATVQSGAPVPKYGAPMRQGAPAPQVCFTTNCVQNAVIGSN